MTEQADPADEASNQPRRSQVPVPKRLVNPHALVVTLHDKPDKLLLHMPKALLPRALRILHGLFVEAELRGYSIGPSEKRLNVARITIGGDNFQLRIKEVIRRQRHVVTEQDKERQQKDYFYRPPQWDEEHTGQLEIRLPDMYGGRSKFADGKRASLEDKLADVLTSIESKHAEYEVFRQHRARQEEERQRQYAVQVGRAKERFWQQQRDTALNEVLEARSRAAAVRELCAEVSAAGLDTELTVKQFVSWSQSYADSIDPLLDTAQLALPVTAEPAAADLEPYLTERTHGWRSPWQL